MLAALIIGGWRPSFLPQRKSRLPPTLGACRGKIIDGLKQLASLGANQARGACSLPSRRGENVMQNWQHQSCDQLVLELERQNRQVPVVKNVKGLVETLVDLLWTVTRGSALSGGDAFWLHGAARRKFDDAHLARATLLRGLSSRRSFPHSQPPKNLLQNQGVPLQRRHLELPCKATRAHRTLTLEPSFFPPFVRRSTMAAKYLLQLDNFLP